jgi:tyrosine-protein kinase Etk/Wzc
VNITEDLYTLLVTQYARARIAEMGELGTVEIVDPAEVPKAPIRPNKKLNLAVALFLGLMSGVGLAFVREAMDTRFRSQDEVRATLRLPVLALIPRIPHHRRRWVYQEISEILLTHYKPGGRVHDAFSSLVFNLRMASPDKGLSTILITGPEPGIGKSTIASNLALALAFQRKKVLLLEADLRRPVLDRVFDTDGASPGLTEWVVGEAELQEVVREVHPEGYGPLHIIFAGHKPPSPADFFASRAFAEALRRLAETYEVIVIDAPPVHAAPEIQILATQVDGVLFLVDAEHTDKRTAQAAREKLAQAHAPLVGVVINRAPPQYFAYYGRYYYRKRYYYYEDEEPSRPFWRRLLTRAKKDHSTR